MKSIDNIYSLITENEITIYWDKPEGLPWDSRYRILVNGKEALMTDRTHATFENLTEGTGYQVQVSILDGKGEVWGASDPLILHTGSLKKRIDITAAPYFAVGDGKTLNTAAIQKAIDRCGAGDTVYLPAGVFLTGALRLHSDMEFYLDQDAVLQGTENPDDYLPRIKSRFEGLEMECYSSLLNLGELDHESGYNCKNVVIRGKGTIASGGRKLAEAVIEGERERLKEQLSALGDGVKEYENENTIPGRVRPRLINMSNSRNVRLSGITLKNGASWNVHMIYSDQIVTDHCVFYSKDVWNGDGWDPDSSTNCTIFGCTFYTGDDSIAIKSGKNPEGNVINRPCEHIRIFDCVCACGHGITMGSEMSGGINDVRIWDCDMSGAIYGIEIKGTKKRGGFVRNVHVRDCTAARIMFHSVTYNDDGIGAPEPPVFEQCSFEHMRVLGEFREKDGRTTPCEAIELCGFDEPGHYLSDIRFRDITIGNGDGKADLKVSMQYCDRITFENVGARQPEIGKMPAAEDK